MKRTMSILCLVFTRSLLTRGHRGLLNGAHDEGKGGTVAVSGDVLVTITEHEDERGCHVVLRGRIDVRTVADLRLTLHRLIANGSTPVLLDLAEAPVGDATGFGFLVECQRRARRAGRPMRIVAADDRTRRLLRRARLHSLLAAPVGTASEPVLAGAAG
jgi:anti-anti-sigma factor